MKISIIIDKNREEEVVVYAHERNVLTEKIKQLCENDEAEISGKKDRAIYKIELRNVVCFVSENSRVYALTDKERYEIDKRIYELESECPENFIKINQSCIANIEKIKSFDAKITGTLAVNFKNGYRDFVSRRRMKQVKERLLKK